MSELGVVGRRSIRSQLRTKDSMAESTGTNTTNTSKRNTASFKPKSNEQKDSNVARSGSEAKSKPSPTKSKSKAKPRTKNPKDSHLYTDDNPSTTLAGTGFSSATKAHDTISLVSARSLTYQYQVINTMYHRAKHHPSMRGGPSPSNSGMRDAMDIFRVWLDETYPHAKENKKISGREFKPLLKKDVVEKYLGRIDAAGIDADFARLYVALAKGKRLANVLVDEKRPEGEDWERRRETELGKLVEEREENGQVGEDGYWSDKGGASEWMLKCIAWAWCPVSEKRLPP